MSDGKNVSVRCMGCGIAYVTSQQDWERRTCSCPVCAEDKAQLESVR